MIVGVASFSRGKDGRQNEDAYDVRLSEHGVCVAAVADGVSGNVGGAMASAIAVQHAIQSMLETSNVSFSEVFAHIVILLRDVADNSSELGNMATTLTCLKIQDGVVRYAHVGDSRIYHLRDSGIVQKTSDQTEAALLLDQGILSPARARNYHRRAVLTSALSPKGEYTLLTGEFAVLPKDRVLLLTDGVYRLIQKKEFRDVSTKNDGVDDFLKSIEMHLLSQGLVDDATMVAIQIE